MRTVRTQPPWRGSITPDAMCCRDDAALGSLTEHLGKSDHGHQSRCDGDISQYLSRFRRMEAG